MPLLEYRCADCGTLFERLVRRTEGADSATCATCGSERGRRLLSVFAVKGGDGESTASLAAMPSSGGCCGGACGCGG